MISPLAYVDPSATIGSDTIIHPFVCVESGVVIGNNCEIMSHTTLKQGTHIGDYNRIHESVVIGCSTEDPLYKGQRTEVHIGNHNTIREHVSITRGISTNGHTSIGNNNHILAGVRLSHDVQIGDYCTIGKGSLIAGNCILDDHAIISSGVLMNKFCRVGSHSLTLSGSVIYKNIPPYVRIGGYNASYGGINTTILQKNGFTNMNINNIAKAYRLVYNSQISLFDAILQIKNQVPQIGHIPYLVDFLSCSDRGVVGKQSPCESI